MTTASSRFADGTERLQRNFGLSRPIVEWLRLAAFETQKSQSALAREAFELLMERYPDIKVRDRGDRADADA